MKIIFEVISIFLLIQLVAAPPPRRTETEEKHHDASQEKNDIEDFGLEYDRYLREVIDLLESDPEFKKKLEDAQEVDIRNGQIAKELEFVDHKVRTKLDEVKRQEIERLRHLAQKQYELANGIDTDHIKVSSEHLDHENPHTFEMEDLKKLIAKVSSDLNEADEKRRREFKEYEMQKEFEKQQKLQHLEGSEKEAFEKQLKENETKHKQHERLHEPGSKQQLEEVWEKQDHMENQEFDPKIFFQLHDLDGNGFWDHNEVKALFLKELDKMYEAGAPEDDMKERVEEMERMREHVFKEADKNKDGLISFEEFLDKTKQPDFEKDPGWESLDQKPVYTHEEYLEFERRRQQEIQRMIQQGLIPPQPVFDSNAGYHPQSHYFQYHPQQFQGYPAGHPPQNDQRYAPNYQRQPQQAYPNQPLQHHQPQVHLNQIPQGYQMPLQNQAQQGYQQHHQTQGQQGYQQHHQTQGQQGFQQPHPNQPLQNQQPQAQQNQGHEVPPSNLNQQPHHNPNPNHQNKPDAYQPGKDPNEIHPNEPKPINPKYSKTEGDNNHPNVINSQYKTVEQANVKQQSNN